MSLTRAEVEAGANGMNPVVDLWKLYQSASAEAKELDVAIRAGVKSHSSKYHNEHGKLLQAEHKRLVWLWKKRERQANKLINSLTRTARQQASGRVSKRHTQKRRFSSYRYGSRSGMPSSAGDTSTSSSDISSSDGDSLGSYGGPSSPPGDMADYCRDRSRSRDRSKSRNRYGSRSRSRNRYCSRSRSATPLCH